MANAVEESPLYYFFLAVYMGQLPTPAQGNTAVAWPHTLEVCHLRKTEVPVEITAQRMTWFQG